MNFAILGFRNVFVFVFELMCDHGVHFKKSEDASVCLEKSNISSLNLAFCFTYVPHTLLFGPSKHLELWPFEKLNMQQVKSTDIFKFIKQLVA